MQSLSFQKYVVSTVMHVLPLLLVAWLNSIHFYNLVKKSIETLARVGGYFLMKKKNKRHMVFVLLRKAGRARSPRENTFSRCSCIEGETPPLTSLWSLLTIRKLLIIDALT